MISIQEMRFEARRLEQEQKKEGTKKCLEELNALQKDLEKEIISLMMQEEKEYLLKSLIEFLTERGYSGKIIHESLKCFFKGSEIKVKNNGEYYIVL